MTLRRLRTDSNWRKAFAYAAQAGNPITREVRDFTLKQVTDIVAVVSGANDGEDWLGLFRAGGVFLYLHAGCDYTGWDCQAHGAAEWHEDLATLVACIPVEEQERLLSVEVVEAVGQARNIERWRYYGGIARLGAPLGKVFTDMLQDKGD